MKFQRPAVKEEQYDDRIAQPEHSSKKSKHIQVNSLAIDIGSQNSNSLCSAAENSSSSSSSNSVVASQYVNFTREDVDPGSVYKVPVVPELTIRENLLQFQSSNSRAFNILVRVPNPSIVATKDEEEEQGCSSADDVGSGGQTKKEMKKSWTTKERVLVFKVPLVTQTSWVISVSEVRRFLMSEVLNSSEVKKPIYINITATEQEDGPELDI